MDVQTTQTERNAMPARGARFYRDDDGAVMFMFVIDPTTVVGPRPARPADLDAHAEAHGAFLRGEALPEPPVEPELPALTAVEPKDMAGFAERLKPAPARKPRGRRKA